MKALINAPICPLMTRPSRQCELGDEALFGMAVEVLEETLPGWYRVRTPYRYEDYAPADCLLFGEHNVQRWLSLPKRVVLKSICDVLSGPAVACFPLVTLTRGALVAPVREPDEKGWVGVELPDGREGYTKSSFLGEYYEKPAFDQEDALRSAIVNSALSYLGTHYRWGGKTPMGIDCSGLASMAYLLNGVVIWRDASIKEGFPLHEIPRERMKPGDLLFFPGHVAVYIGGGEFVHSTAFPGSDGVVLNSLDPGHPRYRLDLDKGMTAVGSLF